MSSSKGDGGLEAMAKPAKGQLKSLFTQELFTAERSSLHRAPLETLIVANCEDFRVIPQLKGYARSLRHLDLQGCDLQAPTIAEGGWKPLASLVHLTVLILRRCSFSPEALHACVASLPTPGRRLNGTEVAGLKVLDVAETSADTHFLEALPSLQPGLTHLSVAGCNVGPAALATAFLRFPDLEYLNIDLKYDAPLILGEVRSRLQGRKLKLRVLGASRHEGLEAARKDLSLIADAKILGQDFGFFGKPEYAAIPPQLLVWGRDGE